MTDSIQSTAPQGARGEPQRVFSAAATNLLGLGGEREIDRYIRGYVRQPETAGEVKAA